MLVVWNLNHLGHWGLGHLGHLGWINDNHELHCHWEKPLSCLSLGIRINSLSFSSFLLNSHQIATKCPHLFSFSADVSPRHWHHGEWHQGTWIPGHLQKYYEYDFKVPRTLRLRDKPRMQTPLNLFPQASPQKVTTGPSYAPGEALA